MSRKMIAPTQQNNVEKIMKGMLEDISNWKDYGWGCSHNGNHSWDWETDLSPEEKTRIIQAGLTGRKAKWFDNKTQTLNDVEILDVDWDGETLHLRLYDADWARLLEINQEVNGRQQINVVFELLDLSEQGEGNPKYKFLWENYEACEEVIERWFGDEIDFLKAVNDEI
tara:strand:- start:95 stop:601 length:507 start_codon:yes stop_codon:yes gene_type:complete